MLEQKFHAFFRHCVTLPSNAPAAKRRNNLENCALASIIVKTLFMQIP